MKFLFLLVSCALFSSTALAANDGSKTTMDPKMAEMMKKYEEAAKPGEPHKVLAGMEGKWKYTSKMWMDANATPEESKGTTQFKMILGGRWLQQNFKGKHMGQPFEGMGMTGYDNIKKTYETMWFDTMSTGVTKGTGTYDTTTKTLTDKGDYSCPISSDKKNEYRSEWTMVDKNKSIFSMYGTKPEGGPEFKMMEITYTR